MFFLASDWRAFVLVQLSESRNTYRCACITFSVLEEKEKQIESILRMCFPLCVGPTILETCNHIPFITKINEFLFISFQTYGYNSKTSFHNSDSDGSRFKSMRGSDHSESHFHQKFEHKSPTFSYGEFYPGKKSPSIDLHEGSRRGNPVLDRQDLHQMVKHGVGMMNVDSVTGQHRLSSHGARISREQAEVAHQNYNSIHLKANPVEHSEYKSSNLASKGDTSYGFPEKGSSRRMGKVWYYAFVR